MSPAAGAVRAPRSTPWAREADDLGHDLDVDIEVGLGAAEAAARLARHGPNEVQLQRDAPLWRSVLDQLRETMILVLLAAAVLTIATGDITDTAVILLVVVINTTVGVTQERRAIHAVAALRQLSAPTARVLRDGAAARIPTRDLVPGDVLLLAAGDVVGADARLVSARELQVDEALLTGESLPSDRAPGVLAANVALADRTNMVHAGTLVAHGTGQAMVVATGAASAIGQVASLLATRRPPATPLQRRLARLGRWLSVIVIAACLLVVVLGLLRGQPWELVAVTGISLAVAAVPESLPAVVAFALAAGGRRMAARGAIIRSLPAVETLGSVTLLASDKTGTLTRGAMECVAVWTPTGGEHGDPRPVLEAVALCNDEVWDPETHGSGGARRGTGAGTEGALLRAAADAGVDVPALRATFPRTGGVAFDAQRRGMQSRHRGPDGELVLVKGAPEAVQRQVCDAGTVATAAYATARRWAEAGHRVLAVATGPHDKELRLLGLVALADPVRPEARDAVLACRAAGITPILVTGDHAGTAQAVAQATGILPGDGTVQPVHARIDPAGKLDLVAGWQRAGHVVAMTGDGVNDAPALRAADIGVAMGRRGTDVAKNAADLVLTDDSLATVVAAVAEGRRVFDNIRRFVRFGLSGGTAEIAVMLAGPLLGLPLPLLPAQILWINLLTHGLPGVAFGAEAAEPDVLQRPPRPPQEGVLTRATTLAVLLIGTVVAAACLGLAWWAHTQGRPWQTMLFVALCLAQLGIALVIRSDRLPVWRVRASANPLLLLAVALSALLLFGGVYLPGLSTLLGTQTLSSTELAIAVAVAALPAIAIEVVKAARHARIAETDSIR
jgi:P-type Ca2+ transporter type 2C